MKIQNLIGGRHCDAATGRTFEKLAPATGDYVAAVPASTAVIPTRTGILGGRARS